jgi:acyl carrier protein
MRERIREFVEQHLVMMGEQVSLQEDEDIFKTGLVDSVFAIELVAFIEQEFDVRVLDGDLEITNFSSISNIANFVNLKRGG